MSRPTCRRSLLAFTLGLILLTPAGFAAGRPGPSWNPWELLARLLAAAVTVDEGCGLDPNGRCEPAAAAKADLDAGCGLDPDGRCLPNAPQLDAGCGLDPSGLCLPEGGGNH